MNRSSVVLGERSDSPLCSRGASGAARTAELAGLGLLGVELIGSLALWAPVPVAWMWVGARVFDVTGSIAADLGVALLGFFFSISLVIMALGKVDRMWMTLRRRAGHKQSEGALTQVVVASATFGLLGFFLWFYVLSGGAFIIPFMPND